jgi:two-component system response regulator YesN
MKSILIVDDEIISRLRIRDVLNWNEYGYSIISEASNGKEALQVINSTKVDLVITDISMPVLNGIELMKETKILSPSTKFIVLSSYDDYEFVREALKLGALDYILKLDLNSSIMGDLLNRASIAIELDTKVEGTSPDKNTLAVDIYSRREELRQLIYGKKDLNDSKQLEKVNKCFPITRKGYALLSFDIINQLSGGEKESLLLLIEDIIQDYNTSKCCMTSLNEITIFFSIPTDCGPDKINHISSRLKAVIKDYFNIDIILYISCIKSDIRKINTAYLEIQKVKKLRNINDDSFIIHYNSTSFAWEKRNYKKLYEIIRILPTYQRDNKVSKIKDEIINFKKEMERRPYINKDDLRYFLTELSTSVNWISLNYEDINLFESYPDDVMHIEEISSFDDLIEYIDFLIETATSLCERIEGSYLVRKVKQHIKKEYKNQLYIGDFAEQLDVSNTYLSSLFKKEIGLTIKDYLIKTRIEAAKTMLRDTTLQIQEIARECGFVNEHYFSTLFKQKTHQTPLDYRSSWSK